LRRMVCFVSAFLVLCGIGSVIVVSISGFGLRGLFVIVDGLFID